MAVLAIPFALSMAAAVRSLPSRPIAVALAYYVVNGTFESMGNVTLPARRPRRLSSDILFALVGGYLLLRTPT